MVDGNSGSRLSDHALQERVMLMLKQTPLMQGMSRRLLADLVRVVGLEIAQDAHHRRKVNFAVLVVAEQTLIIGDGSKPPHPPLDSPPNDEWVVELPPGVYLSNEPAIATIARTDRTIEATRDQAVRYFVLLPDVFRKLPRQVLGGMNFDAVPGGLGALRA